MRTTECRDDRSSKSLAITANGPRCRCIMNTHYVRANRRELTGRKHGHHARIMTGQKEHTREACSKVSGVRYAHTHTHTRAHKRAHTHNDDDDDDVPTLRCYYLASPPSSPTKHAEMRDRSVAGEIVGHERISPRSARINGHKRGNIFRKNYRISRTVRPSVKSIVRNYIEFHI